MKFGQFSNSSTSYPKITIKIQIAALRAASGIENVIFVYFFGNFENNENVIFGYLFTNFDPNLKIAKTNFLCNF